MNYLPLSIQFEWKLKKENQRLERFRSVKILFYFNQFYLFLILSNYVDSLIEFKR